MCKKILIFMIPFNFKYPYIPRNFLQGKIIIVLFHCNFCLLMIQKSNYLSKYLFYVLIYKSVFLNLMRCEIDGFWHCLVCFHSHFVLFWWYLPQEREIIIYHYSCEDVEILINAMFLLFKLITINVFWRPYLPLSSGFCLVSTFW